MISIPKAIIDISTVMIKFFNARIAKHAMEGLIRFNHIAVKAKVFQVNIFIIGYLQ